MLIKPVTPLRPASYLVAGLGAGLKPVLAGIFGANFSSHNETVEIAFVNGLAVLALPDIDSGDDDVDVAWVRLALKLADSLIIPLWYADVGRYHATFSGILCRAFRDYKADGLKEIRYLIRDVPDVSQLPMLRQTLVSVLEKNWHGSLEDAFVVSVTALAHPQFYPDDYLATLRDFGESFPRDAASVNPEDVMRTAEKGARELFTSRQLRFL